MTQIEEDIIAGLQEALDLSPFMQEVMANTAKYGTSYVRITIKDGMPDYELLDQEKSHIVDISKLGEAMNRARSGVESWEDI